MWRSILSTGRSSSPGIRCATPAAWVSTQGGQHEGLRPLSLVGDTKLQRQTEAPARQPRQAPHQPGSSIKSVLIPHRGGPAAQVSLVGRRLPTRWRRTPGGWSTACTHSTPPHLRSVPISLPLLRACRTCRANATSTNGGEGQHLRTGGGALGLVARVDAARPPPSTRGLTAASAPSPEA